SRQRAAHRQSRRRRRIVLRRHGPAARARAAAGRQRRRPEGGRRGGAHVPGLGGGAQQRSHGRGPDGAGPARARAARPGGRRAGVVGGPGRAVPYPADTEIIANVVTSPHHLGVVMVEDRTHRMTEVFGRLAPGRSIDDARAELTAVHAAVVRAHPEAYQPGAKVQLTVKQLRDQIAAPARTVLLVLRAAAALVFVIACSNVANLILARSVRREAELAVRAALGASPAALRRTLLAESLVLCTGGAVLGVLLARPFVSLVARYAARYSIRALEVTVDSSVVWVGAALAAAAAVRLASGPRLPSAFGPSGLGLTAGGRVSANTNRRLRVFATAQIAFSFVLLAGAAMLLATLVSLQTAVTGYDMRNVLAFDIPPAATGVGGPKAIDFYQETIRRVGELPGVEGVAVGSFVPWRDRGTFGGGLPFGEDGATPANGQDPPGARLRSVAPDFFSVLGIPLVAGRAFTNDDRRGEQIAIVSQSVAQRLFANGDAVNRRFAWLDPYFGKQKFRIVGVVADV